MKTRQELLKSLMLAVLIIGVIAALFAAYQFISARQIIATAPDFGEISEIASELEPAQREALLSSVPPDSILRQRQALSTQNQSLIIGGIALACIGIGWLGYDLLNKRGTPQTNT